MKLLWKSPQVKFKGKGISEAWQEAMARKGWEFTDNIDEADLVFFSSDSQLDDKLLGKCPSICYVWGWPPFRMLNEDVRKHYGHQLWLLEKCTRILVPTPATLDQIYGYGLQSEVCIPGIDLDSLKPGMDIRERKMQVLFISRLEYYKNLTYLIQAMSAFEPRIPLIVIGPGDRKPYQDIAEQYRVPVTFMEPTDEEKAKIIAESMVLVHPSIYEGWGLSSLEAIALGTPAIVSDIPIHRWVLKEFAIYADPNPQPLAETIKWVFQNYGQAMDRTLRGTEIFHKFLNMDAACERLWEHIHQSHKLYWGNKLSQDPDNPDLIKRCYEEEAKRNWEYGTETSPEWAQGPQRFQKEWKRHWRASYAIKALKDAGAKKIIDIACGPVYPSIMAGEGFEVEAFDVSEEILRQVMEIAGRYNLQSKIHTTQGLAQELPFADNTFDSAVAMEILEHVPDPEQVIKEALRIIKPGGVVVMTTPIGSAHHDPFHIASESGGFTDNLIDNLLEPWKDKVVRVEKIAEDGTEPSCFFIILRR